MQIRISAVIAKTNLLEINKSSLLYFKRMVSPPYSLWDGLVAANLSFLYYQPNYDFLQSLASIICQNYLK